MTLCEPSQIKSIKINICWVLYSPANAPLCKIIPLLPGPVSLNDEFINEIQVAEVGHKDKGYSSRETLKKP